MARRRRLRRRRGHLGFVRWPAGFARGSDRHVGSLRSLLAMTGLIRRLAARPPRDDGVDSSARCVDCTR